MKFLNEIDGAKRVKQDSNNRFVTDEQIANWNSKSIKNIGAFNSHEELIMYAITEQIPTGQYAFFMDGHASLALIRERDAGTYYEGMAQGSDGNFVVFDVTKQGQMREYGEFDARDIIASLDDIRSIFSQLDDKVDNSRVLTNVPEGAKFTDTITTINGQTGDIELTGDNLDYFDYTEVTRKNVGSTLSEINVAISMFLQYIIGADYDVFNDPTLKEILEVFTIVLGDYNLGVSPSLGEIAELVVGGGGSSGGSIVNLGTFNDEEEVITHVVTNQLPTGHYTCVIGAYPMFMLLELTQDNYYGTLYSNTAEFVYFVVSIYGEIQELQIIDLRDLEGLDVDDIIAYIDSQDALKADKTYVDNKVKTDVPVGAVFTDTVYSHPSSHPANIITESATKRFVTDEEKANWDNVVNKVDKVTGKDLSSEDYTTEEKQKLEGIEQNANHTPNLTLNELTLGGRFKMVYNDIEDSLDFEVI